MKKMIAMMMALVLCFGLVACGGSADSADSGAIKLGMSGPLTGEAAIYGQAVKNGMQIAVDEVNALGGIQLELLFEDDVADGETALNAYNKMIDDGMQVSAGTVTSGAGQAVAPQSYEDQMFALTPSASSTAVIEGNDNVFQVCFSDPNQGSGSATYIKANMNVEKIAIIYRNDDAYSQGIRDTFVSQAATEGLNVVYEGTFTKDTATDFSVQITAAKAAGADLLFLPIYYQPAALILAEAEKQGYEPTFFGVDGMDGILTLENFDTSLAEGVMLLTPFSADAEDEMTQNFVAKYMERTGEIPNQFAADGYDTVYILYNALTKAGCTADMSYDEICAALKTAITASDFSYTGLTGSDMTWAATGEVTKMPVAVVIKDGVYVGA